MSLTINIDGFNNGKRAAPVQRLSRELGQVTGTITFDSSYAEGGEPLTGTGILDANSKYTALTNFFNGGGGNSSLLQLEIDMPNGYTARLDNTTRGSEVLRVYNPHVPPIVFEEKFDADSDSATLKYPAAHINYIATEAAPLIPIFGGVTPITGSVAVDMGYNTTTGVHTKGTQPTLTFYAADGSATTYCSYVTQAWKDVANNMSSCKVTGNGTDMTENWGDGIEWSSDVLDLGTDICAMTSHTWINGGTVTIPSYILGVGVSPAEAAEFAIDFVDSGDADITYLAADATETEGDIIYVQYIKKPSSGFLHDRFYNTTIAESSNTFTFLHNPLMYGVCGMMPSAVTANSPNIVTIGDTVAANQIHFTTVAQSPNSMSAVHMTEEAEGDEDIVPAYVWGNIGEIETQAIEVPGHDYSGLGAIPFRAIGYIR